MKLLFSFLFVLALTQYVLAQTPQLIPGNYQTNFYYQSTVPGALGDCLGLNGDLVFAANNTIWRTDGSVNGTQLVSTISSDTIFHPAGFKKFNGKIYFTTDDGVHGRELWVTDGTSTGTYMVKDINPGAQSSFTIEGTGQNNLTAHNLQEFDGKLYFAADDGVHGRELWSTDGTEINTVLFNDQCLGSCDGMDNHLEISASSNKLFFTAVDMIYAKSVYSSDGTIGGTTRLLDSLISFNSYYLPYGDKVIFTINNNGGIYISDGTVSGTIELIAGTISNTSDVALLNGKAYFFVRTNVGSYPYSLFVTDGTTSGTNIVYDSLNHINNPPTDFFRDAFQLRTFNDHLLFSAQSSINNIELWHSDGTESGTTILKDFSVLSGGGMPSNFVDFNGKIYFRARDNERYDLWYTNGTEMGTQKVFMPGNSEEFGMYITRYQRYHMVNTGNALYYYACYDTALGKTPRVYKLDLFPESVNKGPKISSIDIYPNPSQGFITVDAEDAKSIVIHSIDGRLVYHSEHIASTRHTVDTHNLAAGTYSITTQLSDGTKRYGKFVKQ